MTKILFLYTELADYFMNCLRELNSPEVEIHLVRWPVKKEAPFQFEIPEDIKVYNREDHVNLTLLELAENINPDLIFCSGWMDKGYVEVCKNFSEKIPTVTGMDNKWTGGLKQQMARVASKFTLRTYFSHIWVPGAPQEEYAQKLGFKSEYILKGFYTANTDYFNSLYLNNLPSKKENYPKRFIYMGRYVEFKGVFDMWQAFIELHEEQPNEWELWCLGTGDDWDKRIMHPKIKHIGFVQPSELHKYLREAGVFILPSHKEPWGVVVHEMAAAGFPLLCSNTIGAATAFLEEGKNGYFFKPGNKEEIKGKMKRMMLLQEKELLEMGKYSHQLGQKITPQKWLNEISRLLNEKEKN